MPQPVVTRFVRDLAENLFPNNEFYNYARDHSQYLEGGVVVLPQAGDLPEAFTNPSEYPLVAKARVDGKKEYNIDFHGTRPTHFRSDEALIYDYERRAAILMDHQGVLDTAIANSFAYRWSPTGSTKILKTTGSASAAVLAPGATGNRKLFTASDFRRAQTLMNKLNVPKNDRFALVPSDVLGLLLDMPEFISFEKIGIPGLIKEGSLGRIYGFDVFERSYGIIYDNDDAPKHVDTASATTDDLGVLFWHRNAVTKAKGTPDVYINTGQAAYHGDLFSASVRAGGTIAREDEIGVVALIQDAA